MARQRLEPGEIGKISIDELPTPDGGKPTYRARGRARTRYGKTIQGEARGPSRTAAETKLRKRLNERISEGGGATLTPESTVSELASAWWEAEIQPRIWDGKGSRKGRILDVTARAYRPQVEMIIDSTNGIGGLTLREVRTITLDTWVASVAGDRVSIQRGLIQHLNGMFRWAVRKGITDVNPAREMTPADRNTARPRALTADELKEIRQWIDDYERPDNGKTGVGSRRGGKPRAVFLRLVFELQLGTGARIGETLAIRWQDIDFAASPPTVTICGTIKRRPGKRADGGGLYRQEFGKTDSSRRTVTIPRYLVDRLLAARVDDDDPSGLVIHTSNGQPRDPSNVRTRLRAVRGEKYAWVVPHVLRKTAGTIIAREMGIEAAAAQLGHAEIRTTERAYIEKSGVAPDVTAAMDRAFAPRKS